MVNQEILTALRNAVEHGETLDNAMKVMINSGYNPKEVQEVSQYVGRGIIRELETKPDEELTMPEEKKGFLGLFKRKKKKRNLTEEEKVLKEPIPQSQSTIKPSADQATHAIVKQMPRKQTAQEIKQQIASTKPQPKMAAKAAEDQKQEQKNKPKKRTHKKEIILLTILIVLIGLLGLVLFFRNSILGFFTG